MHRLGLLFILAMATPALANGRRTPGVTEDELKRSNEIEPSVAAAALMPWTVGARHEREGLLISTFGGFDRSKRTPVMQGVLEATLFPRITFRASASNPGMSDQLSPVVGVLVDVLREAGAGLDVALGGEYDRSGWSRVPALVTRAAVGKTLGRTRLSANAAFGLGLEQGERYGDLRVAGLHPIAQALFAGIDTRTRVALERDMDEPDGELSWEVQAGPIMTLAVGRFAFSATGGVSSWKTRSGDTARVGAIGALGFGAAF